VGPVSVSSAAAIAVPELLFRPELFADGAHTLAEPLDAMVAQVESREFFSFFKFLDQGFEGGAFDT
jgi:hypothetical protein